MLRILSRIAGYSALLGACLMFWAMVITVVLVPWQTTTVLLASALVLAIGGILAFYERAEPQPPHWVNSAGERYRRRVKVMEELRVQHRKGLKGEEK